MGTLGEDLRFAWRMLLQRPGFTVAAATCAALGIGATTAIFSVVNAVVMRPLPYREPERLVRVYTEFPTFPNGGLRRFWTSGPEFLDLRRDMRSFETLDAWNTGGVNLGTRSRPERVTATQLSGTLLPALGVNAIRGRIIGPDEDRPGAPLTADISYGLWQRSFGRDPNVVGKETLLDGEKCTIIGVMPKAFQFPPGEADVSEIWTPLRLNPAKPGGRGGHNYYLLGRLRAGVALDQARAEAADVVQRSSKLDSPNYHAFTPDRHPIVMYGLQDEVVAGVRPAMLMLMGAVVFVLLIACLNVANLLLTRSETRQREIAVRAAVGANRSRLFRQFIVEGTLLSTLGAIPGLLLAFGGIYILKSTAPGSIPRVAEIDIDWRVLLLTFILCVATGILFGLAPLMHVVSPRLHEALKAGSGRNTASAGSHRFRRAIVAGELALAMVLLIGSGLMVRAFWKLQAVDAGLRPEGVITMHVALPGAVYSTPASVDGFWNRLLPRLRAIPRVANAAVVSGLPPIRRPNENDTQIEGFVQVKDGPMQNVSFYQVVSDGYFEAMGIPIVEGRPLRAGDVSGAPDVVVINQAMARTFWHNQSPIGRRIRPGFQDPWCTVVGVAADVKNGGTDKPARTELYLPFTQKQASGSQNDAYIILQVNGDPRSVVNEARREIGALDPTLPVSKVRTMDQVLAADRTRPRFLTMLMSLFSGSSLILAALGLYGVISYAVARRTGEFGLRMALGAQVGDVIRIVLGEGMRLGLIGIGVGIVGAVLLTRLIGGLLYGIGAFDVPTFAAMTVVLFGVTLIAGYIPALRATRVDPSTALRDE